MSGETKGHCKHKGTGCFCLLEIAEHCIGYENCEDYKEKE